MSTSELREMVADLARSTRKMRTTNDLEWEEAKREFKRTDLQIKELGKQIGGLGRKFGAFTEDLAYHSIERILQNDFGLADFVTPNVRMRRDDREEVYDVLAYSNGAVQKGMIVEVKSRLRPEDLDQLERKLTEVFHWLPEHKNKTFHGMIACVSAPADLKKQVLKNGWYLARVGDEMFQMETPADFQPKAYRFGETGDALS